MFLQMGGGVFLKRSQKEDIVEKLRQKFDSSNLIVISENKGLDVSAITELRKKVREVDAEFKVVKNTLLRLAAKGNDANVVVDFFKGPSAVMTGKGDPIAPAKALIEFAKNFKKLNVKAGVLDGKLLSADDIKKLASMPSKEVLLSQLLSVFNAVPTSFVRVLSGVQVNLLNVLNSIKDKKE